MRMIQDGLVDAAGNVNIAGRANGLGQAYVDDFLGTLKSGEKDISREAGSISGIMTSIRRDTGDRSGRSGGFDDIVDSAKRSVDGYSGSVGDFGDNVSDSFETAEDSAGNFSDVISSLSTSVRDATSDTSGLSAGLERMWADLDASRFNTFAGGEMWTDGYASGIASLTGEVKNSAAGIGNASLDALAESIDAHSPSRKTQNLAMMWGAGFISNLKSFANPAYSASYQVGQESVDGLFAPLTAFHSTFDGLYSFSPSITPILDLSDVESGMYYLQNEFGNAAAIGVNQTWTPDIRNAEALLSLERPETDINRIIDEMGYLRDDVVRMGEEISRMKVYLDTGALVGEMSGAMDSALGQSQRRSVRSGRR